MGQVKVVMAREAIPMGPSVFLAGPTPERGSPVQSWRLQAAAELAGRWSKPTPLTVISPESRGGTRAERYEDQVDWEMLARRQAHVILFWVPRDMVHMPGMTSNVEFGYDVGAGRQVVLGCPEDCPNPERNRYLIHQANRAGVPVRRTLADTATTALHMLGIELMINRTFVGRRPGHA